jgi:DNA-binding response OmpR family regulator
VASHSNRIDLRSSRVLLVDDNHQSLDLMSQILMGLKVGKIDTCRSAAEAREHVNARKFDLLIVDAEMPGEDGIAFAESVRSASKRPNYTVPIILVSSHTPLAKISRARDVGVNMVLRKPIAPATLLGRIVWLAKNGRPFVESDLYIGPDRRFKRAAPPDEIGERRADALALEASPERAMSQDEIDSLFG